MPRPKRASVQRYHDRVAGRYDDSYDDAYWQFHDALTWDHLKPFIPADHAAEIVDLGCGTGKWGLALLRSGYRVTFVDISAKMLDAARAKADEMTGLSKAEFLRADLVDLSGLPANHFALAMAFGEPIACARSVPEALFSIRRVLRSDGVLVATFDNRLACVEYYLQRKALDELDCFLRDGVTHWLTTAPDEQFPIHTFDLGSLRTALERGGFELIDAVGKTVLPMRQHRDMLEDSAVRRRLIQLEKHLWRDPFAMGRANHLQIAARRRS